MKLFILVPLTYYILSIKTINNIEFIILFCSSCIMLYFVINKKDLDLDLDFILEKIKNIKHCYLIEWIHDFYNQYIPRITHM